jgi:hypothetical protein
MGASGTEVKTVGRIGVPYKVRLRVIMGCIVCVSQPVYIEYLRVLRSKAPLDTYGSLQYIISILSNISRYI